jgi:hypothetical protein
MQKSAFFAIVSCLVLVGCGIGEFFDYDRWPTIEEYQAGYSKFGNPWVGHQIEELVEERGLPDSVLEAKPKWSSFKDGVHVDSYIYFSKTSAGGSCIDTFVVVEATGTIIKYYCR